MQDVVNRKNCIVVSFKKMGNDEQIQKLALLDSGNNLLCPAMSTRLYEELKDKGYISKDVQLKKTMMKANSVQGQKLKVKGILQIETGSIWVSGIKLSLNKYYIIDDLNTEVNLGQVTMAKMNLKWDFMNSYVVLKEKRIQLKTNTHVFKVGQVDNIVLVEPKGGHYERLL